MRHLVDVVTVDGVVTGNTGLRALCGASPKVGLLPKGTPVEDVCPLCAALAGNG